MALWTIIHQQGSSRTTILGKLLGYTIAKLGGPVPLISEITFSFLHHSPELVPRNLTAEVLAAELHQLLEVLGEIAEPELLVLVVLLGPHLELGVLHQGEVGGEHHEVALLVFELRRPRPLVALVLRLRRPLLLEEQPEVLVAHRVLGVGPRAPEAAAVGVTPADGVGPGEGDDAAVVKAHPGQGGY